jgi:integrase/recombinase XerD
MSVRPHPTKGSGWWYVDLGYGKDRQRVPFEGSKAEAEQYEADRKRILRPARSSSCFDRVGALLDRYLESYAMEHQPSGTSKQRERVGLIRKQFGAMLLQDITAQEVERYKVWRLQHVKHTTVNKELSVLAGLFRWSVDMGVLDDPPCKIRRFPPKLTKAPVPQVPSREMMERIIREIPLRVRSLFMLSFMVGLRPGEARGLRQEHWNIERATLAITGKGNKTRHIPVVNPAMAAELTARAQATKSGYLWESPWTKGPYHDIRGALKKAAARAGWTGPIYPHLLRHAAGTEMVGFADLRTVQVMLGHSTSAVTEIYTHIRQDRLREAMERMDGKN